MKKYPKYRHEKLNFQQWNPCPCLAKLLFLLLVLSISHAASADELLISITMEGVSLGEILQEIKRQSGKNILYNNSKIDRYDHESIHIVKATLDEALHECLQGKDLQYRIIENVIIIEPAELKRDSRQINTGLTQVIRGTILDADTRIPLVGANVILLNYQPLTGTVTDAEGNFRIEKMPVGRYDIEVTYIGYEPAIIREVLIGSGKEAVMTINLRESQTELKEVMINAYSNKDRPINSMSTLSARQLSMEEANRCRRLRCQREEQWYCHQRQCTQRIALEDGGRTDSQSQSFCRFHIAGRRGCYSPEQSDHGKFRFSYRSLSC